MKIDLYSINRETQEETLKETIKIDLSCFLYPMLPKPEVTIVLLNY